jgi:quercetin dioxygenase-like cupin family protein
MRDRVGHRCRERELSCATPSIRRRGDEGSPGSVVHGTALHIPLEYESWIVLSGRATVTFDTGEVLELVPGTIASVAAGRSSTWVVHAPIRKFLVVSSARESNA